MTTRRRNWPLRLTVVLVILVGLAVAADRISVAVAQNIAAQKIQESQQLKARPDVDIGGFPFLTQLASDHYDSVQITAHDLPVGSPERSVDLDSVTVHLHDVHTTRSFDEVRADSATADARVTFAVLGKALGVRTLASDGPGRIKATGSATVAGQTVTGTISAAVSATQGKGLVFSDLHAGVAGLSVSGALDALGDSFHVPIPLSGLPFDVQITGLDVDSSGVVVHLAGHDLRYEQS